MFSIYVNSRTGYRKTSMTQEWLFTLNQPTYINFGQDSIHLGDFGFVKTKEIYVNKLLRQLK